MKDHTYSTRPDAVRKRMERWQLRAVNAASEKLPPGESLSEEEFLRAIVPFASPALRPGQAQRLRELEHAHLLELLQ